jgi:hypothetical protein
MFSCKETKTEEPVKEANLILLPLINLNLRKWQWQSPTEQQDF